MQVLRQSLIPRRVSQMYADTKRSYEHMIQNNVLHTSQTVLHTKLRIQKDRLIAWGLEWADANATQGDDIDDSLDRAGISHLVGSIMSSIQDLLERADAIHPQRTISFPGAFPVDKPASTIRQNEHWTPQDLANLGDIVKDLTTSIDTLCDLSRSRQAISATAKDPSLQMALDISKRAIPQKEAEAPQGATLIQITRIDEALLDIPDNDIIAAAASSSPPSYESVAAGSEDRVLAYMTPATKYPGNSGRAAMPVLLEYIPVIDVVSTGQDQPPVERYDDFMEVEPTLLAGLGPTYLGTLKLMGWVQDSRRARNALVYVIPLPRLYDPLGQSLNIKSFTLLSFLHHGADTDSTNTPSLEDRFRLAFNLTSSLLHLHARGLLHRNINSRNVVFFTTDTQDSSDNKPWKNGLIRRPFLTSFDQCSKDVYEEIEEPFISNIYRHPQADRGHRSSFKPNFDVYSLGLLLLEIGLWMPISKLWKTRYTRANFKTRLQTIYTRKLAGKCGTKYMNAVEYCLTADEQTHQAQSTKGNPFVASQNSMYWKGFKVLEKCCLIDDNDESSTDEDVVDPAEVGPDMSESARTSESVRAPEVNMQSTSKYTEPKSKVRAPAFDISTAHLDPKSRALKPTIDLSNAHASQSTPPPPKNRCVCKVWSHDIPAAFTTHWQQSLEPKLNRIFSKIIDRWESYSIELFMAGETAEAARPTIYMVCASVEKARKVLQYVNQDRGLFDIKVSKGAIFRSKAGKNRKRRGKGKRGPSTGQSGLKGGGLDQPVHSHYQERPACGASIGAYLDEQHLPPVSFGGTVLVDGEPYGMSVHHMLENDDIDFGLDDDYEPLERSMAPEDIDNRYIEGRDSPYLEETHSQWLADTPPEALYPFEISDEDDDEGYLSDSLSDFDPSQWDTPPSPSLSSSDDLINMGDTPGISPESSNPQLLVTQPAIDDVPSNFFPNASDMDQDHLDSHTLGHIHASSGIRRTRRHDISHEVDWALIKMRPHRTPASVFYNNTLANTNLHPRGPRPHSLTPSSPATIIPTSALGSRNVHAHGRTSGLQTGTILPTMAILKMPGRISHSSSWQVLGNFGQGGDSGAWVIDSKSGGVCAHVLAWSAGRGGGGDGGGGGGGRTYVAPMEVMFEDMERVLGCGVELPPGVKGNRQGEEQLMKGLDASTAGIALSDVDDDDDADSTPLSQQPRRQTQASIPQQPQQLPSPSPSLCSSRSPSPSPSLSLTLSRPTTPPITTSPPPPLSPPSPSPSPTSLPPRTRTRTQPSNQKIKRKSAIGSEMLIEKGEERFRASCQRMSVS
ncbi:MAG: hypothetical protein Q9169_002339 [Polycauliona sp. 2 TL-2023]